MRLIGPTKWVSWMKERVEPLPIPVDVTAICLNYDKDFKRLADEAIKALPISKRIFFFSTGHPDELRQYAGLDNVLDSPKVEFIQSPEKSLIEHLRHVYKSPR